MTKTADINSSNVHASRGSRSSSSSNGRRQYKGVRMRSWGAWVSEIRAPNKKARIWLGSYSTPEAAARAYDAALVCLKGGSAAAAVKGLNFSASVADLHLPEPITSPKSIQRVAAAAAAANGKISISSLTSQSSCSSPDQTPSLPLSSDASVDDETVACTGQWPAPMEDIADVVDFEALLQSPRCMDYMLNPSAFFAPAQADDQEYYFDEDEIRLWSFS